MAAITPSSISADTVHGQQFFDGGSILVLPFTMASFGDTWQAPKGMNPTAVAWQNTDGNAVAVTLSAAKVVTFATGSGGETGNLILVIGGGA